MDPSHRYTPRERLIRVGGGAGLVVLGCVIFVFSMRLDVENRAAWIGIIAILAGISIAGQGLRGHRDGVAVAEEARVPPPGPPVSAERTVAGILAAWIIPGLGHYLIGRRAKAWIYFLTITITFVVGVLLAEGRNLNDERDWVYFLAYMFNAGETAIGWLLTRHLELTHHIRYLHVGFLYTAVACLLNIVAMMDFVSICGRSALAAEAGADASTQQGDDE